MKNTIQAFPRDNKWGLDGSIIQEGSRGMSLRDYFAAHALNGILQDSYVPEFVAERAYAIADAMLREREADDGM
jgi:hypothetical protein